MSKVVLFVDEYKDIESNSNVVNVEAFDGSEILFSTSYDDNMSNYRVGQALEFIVKYGDYTPIEIEIGNDGYYYRKYCLVVPNDWIIDSNIPVYTWNELSNGVKKLIDPERYRKERYIELTKDN